MASGPGENKAANAVISIRGAREHNLRSVDLDIPRDQFVVITGLSGSGKSSLAFDTIYAEGQRRYVESLSAYARQFLELMQKPEVDSIEGLSPAISIEQKTTSKSIVALGSRAGPVGAGGSVAKSHCASTLRKSTERANWSGTSSEARPSTNSTP